MTLSARVPPASAATRRAGDWPEARPVTVGALMRTLSLHHEPADIQRLHLRSLWEEPEYRPILEPLAGQLRERGLL